MYEDQARLRDLNDKQLYNILAKERGRLLGEHCHQELGTAALEEPALGSSRLKGRNRLPLAGFEAHHVVLAN